MPGISRILADAKARRIKRIHNLPVIRVQLAREAAIVMAEEAKGESLSRDETDMVKVAAEAVIDVFEASTKRVDVCPKEDSIITVSDDGRVECPNHGVVGSVSLFGVRGTRLAVIFTPLSDKDRQRLEGRSSVRRAFKSAAAKQ
jgi:hypothetical protein